LPDVKNLNKVTLISRKGFLLDDQSCFTVKA